MLREIRDDAEQHMKKAVEGLRKEFTTIRAGRANPSLLDKIQVEYYGAPTPINQLGNISAPEPRMLVIQAWDRSCIANIEKAILKSDLGLTPTNDGQVIRIVIPQLTQERRVELVKQIKKKAEEFRVIVRNVRRQANDDIKACQKEGLASQDECKRAQEDIQKLTDKYIKELEALLDKKEAEVLEV